MIEKNRNLTHFNIRDEIYLQTKECSVHNPLIIKYFINKFKARKILDMSSGWGDRLIGSILCDIDLYLGCDPNINLHKGYQEIIELFSSNNAKYIIYKDGFQDIELNGEKFDLMYSSPPYFDYEKYSDDDKQSIKLWNTEELWLNNFLLPSMNKIINHMKKDGHIVLYFGQEKGRTYVEKWFEWMKKQESIKYIGNIFYGELWFKKLNNIFIFKKLY